MHSKFIVLIVKMYTILASGFANWSVWFLQWL